MYTDLWPNKNLNYDISLKAKNKVFRTLILIDDQFEYDCELSLKYLCESYKP